LLLLLLLLAWLQLGLLLRHGSQRRVLYLQNLLLLCWHMYWVPYDHHAISCCSSSSSSTAASHSTACTSCSLLGHLLLAILSTACPTSSSCAWQRCLS
jgi:hypothetical protein